jgi:hypothetical protein
MLMIIEEVATVQSPSPNSSTLGGSYGLSGVVIAVLRPE